MSQQTSPYTGKKYGLKRVCSAWDVARSTFYIRQVRKANNDQTNVVRSRRGPKTAISDEELIKLIRQDLEYSPFIGEGHRKVYARLNRRLECKVSKKRVLRLMKEHNLLSPHRVKKGCVKLHDGRITTDEPNKMLAADGAKVETIADGWVWVFWSIEHWNAECMGWYVTKNGNRFAALEPIAMGIEKVFGSSGAGVARGLQLRIYHGSQYKSDDFKNQIQYWGIAPSMGIVREPETNGVVERFNRTFKEQIIHGRVYQNVEALRKSVGAFVIDYNESWLLEKFEYKSPLEVRKEWIEKEKKLTNLLALAEGERSTATSLGRPQGGDNKVNEIIHRVPSVERSTATSLGKLMLAGESY